MTLLHSTFAFHSDKEACFTLKQKKVQLGLVFMDEWRVWFLKKLCCCFDGEVWQKFRKSTKSVINSDSSPFDTFHHDTRKRLKCWSEWIFQAFTVITNFYVLINFVVYLKPLISFAAFTVVSTLLDSKNSVTTFSWWNSNINSIKHYKG